MSLDPWGHLVPQVFKKEINGDRLDVRPSINVMKVHIKMSKIDEKAKKGEIEIDGKIVLQSGPLVNVDEAQSDVYPGDLPGVAQWFSVSVLFWIDVSAAGMSLILESCSRFALLLSVRRYRRDVSRAYRPPRYRGLPLYL